MGCLKIRAFKRAITVLVLLTMLSGSAISVFADSIYNNHEKEELRLAIRGDDEDVAAYPNGRFEFLATQITTSEDISSAEITILRKGGTSGKATVTLKIIDVSAEYGVDYVLKIPFGTTKLTMPKNSDASPLIESFGNGGNGIMVNPENEQITNANGPEQTEVEEIHNEDSGNPNDNAIDTVEDGHMEDPVQNDIMEQSVDIDAAMSKLEGENDASANETLEAKESGETESIIHENWEPGGLGNENKGTEEEDETLNVEDEAAGELIGEGDNSLDIEDGIEELEEDTAEEPELVEIRVQKNIKVKDKGEIAKTKGLARAYENSIGRAANKNDWRLSTKNEAKEAKAANDRFLSEIESITYDLEFEDGEYMKKIYFCTIDDNISEGDEQVVLTLQNATAGVLGDMNTAYVNIRDNDEYEKPEFELKEKTIYVNRSDDTARVTIIRSAGLYQYASIIAATADISAIGGLDFEAASEELIFVPGIESQTVEIPLIKDETWEGGDKTFALMFGNREIGGFSEELTALIIIQDDSLEQSEQRTISEVSLNNNDKDDKCDLEPVPHNLIASNQPLAAIAASMTADAADEKVIEVPRIFFRKGELYCKGRYGFWPDANQPAYPQAAYAEYTKGSYATMIVDTYPYGIDYISWDWLNDIDKPTNAISTMGFLKWYNYENWWEMSKRGLSSAKTTKIGSFNYIVPGEYHLTVPERFDRTNEALYFQTGVPSGDRSWLYVYNVKLHYKKYNFEFGNTDNTDDPDIWIQPMNYTGKSTAVPNGNKVKAGGIKVKDTTKGFYKDTIVFEPVYNPQIDLNKNYVYLWGFKLEDKLGRYQKRIAGDTLILDEATISMLDRDGVLLNDGYTIKVKPIFAQRVHNVEIVFDRTIGGVSGFNSGDIVKVNSFDNIALNGYANAPKFAAGYFAEGYNYSDITAANPTPYRAMDITAQTNQSNPGKIEMYHPSYDIERLTLLYADPEMNIRYHPRERGTNELGEAAVQLGDVLHQGRFDAPIRISPLVMDNTYQMLGIPADGYLISWRDFTGDVNNDGILSAEEKLALKDGNVISQTIRGNTFYYRPVYPNTKLYYTFEPKAPSTKVRTIQGGVYLKGGTILNRDGIETPIEGAAVTVGNEMVYTDVDGEFSSSSSDYDLTGIYSLKINYKGYDFISRSEVNAWGRHVINSFDTLTPEDFRIYKTPTNESERLIKPIDVDNGNAIYRFCFRVPPAPTVKASKATIRVYSKDGKDVRLEIPISTNSNDFEIKIIPSEYGIMPGDYMTVQLMDQNGKTYFENQVGFSFVKSLDLQTFDFIQGFTTPITPVLDLIGKVNLVSSIGLSGKVTEYFERTDNLYTMNFGFSKDYNKVKETVKITDVKESSDTVEKQKEKTDAAVAKDDDGKNTKKSSVTSSISFGVSCGISVIMELDADPNSDYYNEFYFKQMVLMGSMSGSYGRKYEIMTPIGVPVFITWDIGGIVSVAYAYEQYDNKKFYFNENKPIILQNAGTNNTNRDFTVIGRYYIEPFIKIGAGVGYSLLNVSVNGRAGFGLDFTTINQGRGDILLSAEVKLKLLFFSKSWSLGSTSFELFSYGDGMYSMLEDNDYRYDEIDTMEQAARDYLENRTSWNGGMSRSRLFAASDAPVECVLQAGAYPNPETKLIRYGDKVLMVFIDDDGTRTKENRTILKYSIFDGSYWSTPRSVDDDGTLDCQPNLFDLGDRILLTWSNSSKVFSDDANAIKTVSSLDICGAFFNKETNKFGDISQITKTTDEDVSADTMPTVAYDESTRKLMLYYTKTEYAEPDSENDAGSDALIGDITDPFSLIAYTCHDEKDGWKKTYTADEKIKIMENGNMDEDEFVEYENNWYGQQFLDLAPQIKIDESGIMGDDNYWATGADIESAVAVSPNDKAIVLEETAISYNNLSLFAYVMDNDGDKETFDDQDIYLQIYDFEDNIFTHPIQLTNDNKKDSNIRFIRHDGETYLYYISDGDIKYTNISSIVKGGLIKKTNSGKDFYILDKRLDKTKDSGYEGMVTVVKHKEDNPISEFEIKTDDKENIYLAWPEIIITYKDGVDKYSKEAALPENQYRETQLFIARYSYKDMGDMSIGDWSMPIQFTHEKGANLTKLDFVIMDDGILKAVYNKSYSFVTEEGHVAHDEDNASLIAADFIPTSQILMFADDISFTRELAYPGSSDYISVRIKNDGLETLKGYKSKIYECKDDEKLLLGESLLDNFGILGFPGGKEVYIGTPWEVPNSLDGLYIEIVIEDGEGNFIAAAQKDVERRAILELSNIRTNLTDIDLATVSFAVTNTGNTACMDGSAYINIDDANVDLMNLDLAIGECRSIDRIVNLKNMFVKSTDKNNNIIESAQIEVRTKDSSLNATVTRTATAEDIELIGLIPNISFKNDALSLMVGSEKNLQINADRTYSMGDETKDFNSLFDVVWRSSDENIVKVFNDGSMVGINTGKSIVSAYVLPKSHTYYATNLTNPIHAIGLETRASEAVKQIAAQITVVPKGDYQEDNDTTEKESDKDSMEDSASVKAIIKEATGGACISLADIFNKKVLIERHYEIKDDDDEDLLVMVDKHGNILPFSYYDPNTKTMNALVDDDLMDYSIQSIKVDFADAKDEWYEKAINFLAARNIIKGTAKNKFEPDKNIKRADLVLLLVRMLGVTGDVNESFRDVDPNSYYANAVAIAREMGIIFGDNQGNFNPEEEISRQDMFTIVYRMLKLIKAGDDDSMVGLSKAFTDSCDIADYAKEGIMHLAKLGLANGYNGFINPNSQSKRSDTAQLIFNIYKYLIIK